MAQVTVQDLKQTLAAVLERVGLGEWFTVLRHGKPVARLGPTTEPGLHIGARHDSDDAITPCGRRLTGGSYLDVLAEDRGGDHE